MSRRTLPPITDALWLTAVDDYELGHKSGRQIARELGMSPATISRRMRKMGAVKGSRVAESIEPLVNMLERKAKRAAFMALSDSERRRRAVEASCRAAGHLVAALIAADQQGDITLANPVVNLIAQSLRSKR